MGVIVDDRDASLQTHGPWKHTSAGTVEYFSGTTSSGTSGATAEFTFVGTSVGVFGTVAPGTGATLEFSVDHGPSSSFPVQSQNSALFHQRFFMSGPLSDGNHTLYINLTSPSSQGIGLDYFLYNTTSTSGKTLFIDNSDTRMQYSTAGWKKSTEISGPNIKTSVSLEGLLFNEAAHVSTGAGSTVSFEFEVVYGKDGVGVNASVAIDGGSPFPIPAPSGQQGPVVSNYNLFNSQGIGFGKHTIILTTLDDKHPLIIDYLTYRNNPGPPAGDATGTQGYSSSLTTSTNLIGATNPADASSPPQLSSLHSLNVPVIVGGAVGGLVLILLLIALVFWSRRRRAVQRPGAFPVGCT
ncbi:hypothetical protein B0H15DRAFT_137060 [Mycena belliarum]|uniref:Uncharacterized protein n=1 Tax=Mycena belliarum TaxID=1033014 RepID=A0AAD6UEU6_9AGAR|nr:hypothetical protein B0H15DRAFT_137060 [Mycena belliae]